MYFEDKLGACSVEWSSKRMTLCGGVCEMERGGGCRIKLSAPLLQLRPSRDVKETLLHEMIHAYVMLQGLSRTDGDPGGALALVPVPPPGVPVLPRGAPAARRRPPFHPCSWPTACCTEYRSTSLHIPGSLGGRRTGRLPHTWPGCLAVGPSPYCRPRPCLPIHHAPNQCQHGARPRAAARRLRHRGAPHVARRGGLVPHAPLGVRALRAARQASDEPATAAGRLPRARRRQHQRQRWLRRPTLRLARAPTDLRRRLCQNQGAGAQGPQGR